MVGQLLIFGMGYVGHEVATYALNQGWKVHGTRRSASILSHSITFDEVAQHLPSTTHILVSTPPVAGQDPAYAAFASLIAAAPQLQWIGYYSSTGVYGDHEGRTVDENTEVTFDALPERGKARFNVEKQWAGLAKRCGIRCDIMRLGGIYGPGRSAFDLFRETTPSVIYAPQHVFSRIHRDDIAEATFSAMVRPTTSPLRLLNFTDDHPSPRHDVVCYAATLLNQPAPRMISLEEAWPTMSEMAQSFWKERRTVESQKTKLMLARRWKYASYRKGLKAILQADPTLSSLSFRKTLTNP